MNSRIGRPARTLLTCAVLLTLLLQSCATLQPRDPLQVTVAGIDPLPSEGLEFRLLVKLRVQNPNAAALDYKGIALTMDVQGNTFASGVANTTGTVPGYGEAVLNVPVTISAFRIMRQAMTMVSGKNAGRISYAMKGKMSGSGFGTHRFATQGEFEMPTSTPGSM